MTVEVQGMTIVGLAALIIGLVCIRPRFRAASGPDKVLALGPVFEAVSLAIFAMEHFLAARDLMGIVPRWLPGHLFWTYFVGAALMAAAISFLAWRHVPWSATLLALLFLLIVVTIDLPGLPRGLHNRLFWTVTVREISFAGGAMVLAGSVWQRSRAVADALITTGRGIVASVMIFYGIEHFFFLHNVPGVPLEKLTPAWIPAPVAIASSIGITLIVAGIAMFFRPAIRTAAAVSGSILVLLTVFFYVPIFVREIHTSLAVEGINYVGDTLLFAATILLAGRRASQARYLSA